jgi:hypothetical protein
MKIEDDCGKQRPAPVKDLSKRTRNRECKAAAVTRRMRK